MPLNLTSLQKHGGQGSWGAGFSLEGQGRCGGGGRSSHSLGASSLSSCELWERDACFLPSFCLVAPGESRDAVHPSGTGGTGGQVRECQAVFIGFCFALRLARLIP